MKKMRTISRMLKCCLAVLITAAALLCVSACSEQIGIWTGFVDAGAAELTDDSFSELRWKLQFGDYKIGTVQSVCTTEDYIITIDNVADDASKNDIVSAYYKNSTDENGNPVEQYSLAKRVSDFNWEHGNCMTYNPNTGLIYVSLYTNTTGDNAGCIYEMNPDTLEYVGKIQIGDGSYNILGLGYKPDTDQYVMQTDSAGEFSMKLLDSDFQIIEDYGPVDPSPGTNFQALLVSGDYVLNLPVTVHQNIGEWIDVFSLSRRSVVYSARMDIDLDGTQATEGEAFCMLDSDTLLLILNVLTPEGANMVRFYTAEIPGDADSASENAAESADSSIGSASGESLPSEEIASSVGAYPASVNENTLGNEDGSTEEITEAPAIRMLNSFLNGSVKMIRAFVTGNRKQIRQFGQHISHAWKTFAKKIHAFHPPKWLPYVIIFIILLALGPGMLLYMIHLKRARRRLQKRTREMREEIRRKMEEDSDDLQK